MIVLIAQYTARPGVAEAMAEAFGRMERAVRTSEPGCRAYRVSRSVDDDDRWVIYEEYVDETALSAHRVTPHFRKIIEGEMAELVKTRERSLYGLVVPNESAEPSPI